jgi:phage gp29-like protein
MIKKFIQKLFVLPTKTRIIQRGNAEPPAQAHLVDVDRLHGALRAAEAGNTTELFSLYRDIIGSHSHLQTEFSKRKLAVLGDTFHLIPHDLDDAALVKYANDVKEHLESLPNWMHILAHMLDSCLYPVAVTDRLYKSSNRHGWRYELKELTQIKHHHLSWQNGDFSLRLTDDNGNITGNTELITQSRYIIHRAHILTCLPDWHGGPMRAVLFWWLFSVSSRDWWARFLERFGAPFLEGRYDRNDDSSRFELQDAFQAAQKVFGIVVSNDAEIKLHEANSNSGGAAFEAFHAVANKEISKIVVGQTLSAEGQNLGLGGGQASVQAEVRDDIRQFDAKMLSHTIRTQILAPLWIANGWTHPIPSVSFGGESKSEQSVTSDVLNALTTGGLRVTDDGIQTLSKKFGLTIERIPAPNISLAALSATQDHDHLLPTVTKRAARQRLARRSLDDVIAAASPQLAKTMRANFESFTKALAASTSAEDAINRLTILTAEVDKTDASLIINHTLTTAAANALIASDNTH